MSDDTIRAVDLFCGAGGTLEGLAQACEDLGRELEVTAVNHWETAIETHQENHPNGNHHISKVEELHPPDVVDDGELHVLIASPECTHFSSARGGKPVNEQKRASPWHVLDWIEKLRPQNVLLENVPELESWGPVDEDGQPSRNGEIFDSWINAFHALGYSINWTQLNAADYGDATSRKRLFVIGRRDNGAKFPEQTHSENGEVPGTEEWRSAAEIIDWSDPGESIWERSRPLVNNTMQRIAEGIRRHGSGDLEPFADAIAALEKEDVEQMQGNAVPAAQLDDDVVADRGEPFLVKYYGTSGAKPVDEPMDTITAGGQKFGLCVPYLLRQQSGGSPPSVEQPVPTIASKGAISLIESEAFVLPRNGYHRGLHSNPAYDPSEQPLHTVTASNHDGHLVRPSLIQFSHGGKLLELDDPLPTITTARGGVFAKSQPYLVPFYGERPDQDPRTHDLDDRLPTVPASKSPAGVCSPFLVEYYGNGGALDVGEPLPTVTTRDRFALCVPDLYPFGIDVRFRMLKPRELARAMGFPDDYEFAGNKTETIKQIGNAVPVNLSESLCKQLLLGEEISLQSFMPETEAEADD